MTDDQTPAEDPAAEPIPEPTPDPTPDPSPGPHLSEFAQPELDVLPTSAEPRRYPSTIGGLVYLAALGACIAGLVIVTRGHWRLGIAWIASALIGSAVARLLLPGSQAGMLEVRRRFVDVVLLAGFGIVMLVLVASIGDR